MTAYDLFLTIHIIAGFCSLVAALIATIVKQWNFKHHWHVQSGRVFLIAFDVVFFTAIVLVFLKPNAFLFLIALFSFYLGITGFRYAKTRKVGSLLDKVLQSLAAAVAITMIVFGVYAFLQKDTTSGIVSSVFGIIMLLLAAQQLLKYKKGLVQGKERLALHLTFMLAATIAIVTAFVVTNFALRPAFVLWLLPSAIISPYIAYWNRKILK